MDGDTIPQEAGINERAVSFTKGCYVGQETVARLHYKGKPNRHLRGLRLRGARRAAATRSCSASKEVGTVGSVVRLPAARADRAGARAARGRARRRGARGRGARPRWSSCPSRATVQRNAAVRRAAGTGSASDSPLLGGTLPSGRAPRSRARPTPTGTRSGDELGLPRRSGRAAPPRDPRELRELIPPREPGRALDDWGRSERVFDLIEPLLDFYYRYWFRVEVEGVENVPSEGGALLVSNHSGALPPDAPMIMQAIRHEHPRPRPLYMLGEHWFKGYPGVGLLDQQDRGGRRRTRPTPSACSRDEGRLALVFPEGQKGSRKLYWQRYRLRRFGRGGFVRTAIRARRADRAGRGGRRRGGDADLRARAAAAAPDRAHLLPGEPRVPALRPGRAALMYLPAKFRIRFLEPIDLSALRGRGRRGPGARPGHRRGHPRPDPGGARLAGRCAYVRLVRLGSGRRDDGEREDATRRRAALAVIALAGSPAAATTTSRTTRARRRGRPHRRDPDRQGDRLADRDRRRAGA